MGEHFLMFELDADSSSSTVARVTPPTAGIPLKKKTRSTCVAKMIVHEALTVMQLKELLLASWDTLAIEPSEEGLLLPPKPQSVHHIRMRDAKVPGNSGLGTFMRSERVLYRCLLGISDGRKIIVQVSQVCTVFLYKIQAVNMGTMDRQVLFLLLKSNSCPYPPL
jgi:hypothetical protein